MRLAFAALTATLAGLSFLRPAAARAQGLDGFALLSTRRFTGCETFACLDVTLRVGLRGEDIYRSVLDVGVTLLPGAQAAFAGQRVQVVYIPRGEPYAFCSSLPVPGGGYAVDAYAGAPLAFVAPCDGRTPVSTLPALVLQINPLGFLGPGRTVSLSEVAVVPEPTTLALAGAGVVLLGAWARRRRTA
jgi:hypothetical protein